MIQNEKFTNDQMCLPDLLSPGVIHKDITPYLHPITDLSAYQEIRKMTPLENEVEQVIERDPEFLQYNKSKKKLRQNRQPARKARRNN